MKLIEKLSSISKPKIEKLQNGEALSIEQFWQELIQKYLPEKDCVLAWHKLIMEYINTEHPIFAIRGYYSFGKERYNELRRGFLSKAEDFTFFYTDNYFAAYFQKMVIDGYVPTITEFADAFEQRKFPLRFGPITKEEKELFAIKQGKDPQIGSAGFKLAHIIPVGKEYIYNNQSLGTTEILETYFPKGERGDWNLKTDVNGEFYERDFSAIKHAKKYAIAHFLRFIHPFNYFLCPKKDNETNDKCKEVAEYQPLLDYAHDFMLEQYGTAYTEFLELALASSQYYCSRYNIETSPIKLLYGLNVNMVVKKRIPENEIEEMLKEAVEIENKIELLEESERSKKLKKMIYEIKKQLEILKQEETKEVTMIKTVNNIVHTQETIQDWIKRIFKYLLRQNILTEKEIILLHDLGYSKRTFGIAYPLFVDNQISTKIQGHNRYWQTPIERYYICSQWWKQQDWEYDANIRVWLSRVCPKYIELGLDRYEK